MGIPAYFSYILRSHRHVLQPAPPTTVDRLYMDCNSILYDVFRACTSDHRVPYDEAALIRGVIAAIRGYVERIRPRHLVYIAFDGVAPVAKMNQQRQRRFRSEFLKQADAATAAALGANALASTVGTPCLPSTSMFTPGTAFMTTLARHVQQAFPVPTQRGGKACTAAAGAGAGAGQSGLQLQYIVSASDEPGEGEHKLTQHMRDFPDASHTVTLYGLDSDLIMLAIYHCQRFRDFHIFREAPEFASVTERTERTERFGQPPPQMFYMNVPQLAVSIYSEVMQPTADPADPADPPGLADPTDLWRRVYDYVFLCFFLGNDFLPHFPALSLRSHGIQVLTDTYRTVIASNTRGNTNTYLVDIETGKIQWKHVHTLIYRLAAMEHELWLKEYAHRDKLAKRYHAVPRKEGNGNGNSNPSAESILEELPIRMRGKELYIAPWEVGWEARYYRSLFPSDSASAFGSNTNTGTSTSVGKVSAVIATNDVCVNYLEALEWVFTYYVRGCPDWRWQYRYMYPPLLRDLTAHVPMFDTSFLGAGAGAASASGSRGPCTPLEQLRYVLPPSLHRSLIPGPRGQDEHEHDQEGSVRAPLLLEKFEWAFCTYFWESHLVHQPAVDAGV